MFCLLLESKFVNSCQNWLQDLSKHDVQLVVGMETGRIKGRFYFLCPLVWKSFTQQNLSWSPFGIFWTDVERLKFFLGDGKEFTEEKKLFRNSTSQSYNKNPTLPNKIHTTLFSFHNFASYPTNQYEIGIHFFLKRNKATIHSSPSLYPKSSATAMKNVLQ